MANLEEREDIQRPGFGAASDSEKAKELLQEQEKERSLSRRHAEVWCRVWTNSWIKDRIA